MIPFDLLLEIYSVPFEVDPTYGFDFEVVEAPSIKTFVGLPKFES
ncbi:hypothetical protein [Streptococcus gallolyticus]|nr:hypothetical protein [Streptococcus gallolyticus]